MVAAQASDLSYIYFYLYDALGRRVARLPLGAGPESRVFVYSGGQVIAEYEFEAAPNDPSDNHIAGSYIDEPVVRLSSSGIRYYHGNQQYSIIALTDGGGSIVERYAYTAYGQLTITNAAGTIQPSSPSNNRYTYTGREWDDKLILYHFRARMYDPVAGRFLSRDPSRYMDGYN